MNEPSDQRVIEPPAQVRLKLVLWGLYDVSLVTGTFGAKFRITMFWSPKSDLSEDPKVLIKNNKSVRFARATHTSSSRCGASTSTSRRISSC